MPIQQAESRNASKNKPCCSDNTKRIRGQEDPDKENDATIGNVTTPNPHLFLDLATLGLPQKKYTVSSLQPEPGNWISVNQFCSLLSVYWINHSDLYSLAFMNLSKDLQLEYVNQLISFESLADQVNYAARNINGLIVEAAKAIEDMETYPTGTKIWFGNNIHVMAAVTTAQGVRFYNPDSGEVEAKTRNQLIAIMTRFGCDTVVVAQP